MQFLLAASLLVLTAAASAAANPRVEKVEPPNWWADHSISTVRILVRGEGFGGASVTSRTPKLRIANIRVNERGDHVFFDVKIADKTKPGSYKFDLTTLTGAATVNFEVLPRLAQRGRERDITSDDVIYLIMTDRFSDGDGSNNQGVDRTNPRAWHGGDIRGVISKLDYLKDLGITAIWLTPWYDNPDEPNMCDQPWCPYTNYHGYHAIDYYAVENHFGTMADLKTLVAEARKRGIKIIQDQVANHVGVQHEWVKRPPLPNWFSPFKKNTFNDSVLFSPNSSPADRDVLLSGWFNEFLPDLNQNEPEVSRYLIQNALWWIGMTGIDGIRQDTIQYMPRTFIRDWSAAILAEYPNFYMVGEVLEMDSAHLAFFQGGKPGWDGIDTKLPSVFDFNLWEASRDVFTGKKPASALRDVLKYDGLYSNVNRVTTLTGNHDLDRFMSTPGATPESAMLHMAFMLSVRGIPQMYYGDELGMTGGHDPDNRKDFPERTLTADEKKMLDHVKNWIALRQKHIALRQGKTVDLFYDEEAYVLGRTFQRNEARLVQNDQVLVGFNFSAAPKIMVVSGQQPGRRFTLETGEAAPHPTQSTLIVDANGKLNLEIPARTAVLYSSPWTLTLSN